MKVKELIEQLKKYPSDLKVMSFYDSNVRLSIDDSFLAKNDGYISNAGDVFVLLTDSNDTENAKRYFSIENNQ